MKNVLFIFLASKLLLISLFFFGCGKDRSVINNSTHKARVDIEKSSVGECTYKDKIYKVGETFLSEDGCNSCSCVQGNAISCTTKGCD